MTLENPFTVFQEKWINWRSAFHQRNYLYNEWEVGQIIRELFQEQNDLCEKQAKTGEEMNYRQSNEKIWCSNCNENTNHTKEICPYPKRKAKRG